MLGFFCRDKIVEAFKQQEVSQDQKNQEMARKSKLMRAAKSAPSQGGKPALSGKPSQSRSGASSKPLVSPHSRGTASHPLAGIESMFKEQAANLQVGMEVTGSSVSGMMPGGLAQQSPGLTPESGYPMGMGMPPGELGQNELQGMPRVPLGMPHLGVPPPPYSQHQFIQPDFQQQQYYHQQQQLQHQQQLYYSQHHYGPEMAYDQVGVSVTFYPLVCMEMLGCQASFTVIWRSNQGK